MNPPRGLDVSALPGHAFGHRSLMWWGTLGMMLTEGAMFAALLASYFYLQGQTPAWPPGLAVPGLRWATLNTALLLASCLPNHLCKKAAEREDLPGARRWLLVAIGFALAFVVVRALEFRALNCLWSDNAYASVVWTLLGFHTLHLATDLLDSVVLAVLLFTGPIQGKRFVDVSENAMYWYFVVGAWLPIYVTIYLVPRWN